MNDSYLWDRTGEVDPETERLERLLAPFAHTGRPLALESPRPARPPSQWRRFAPPLALAATLVVFVGGLWRSSTPDVPAWVVESRHGVVGLPGRSLAAGTRVGAGALVVTGTTGRVSMRASGLGEVALGPGSLLRVRRVTEGRHVLVLEAGTLDADISASPGAFVVETPAARAIDLGCRFRLTVGDDGAGLLHVTLGWVGLAYQGRESLVPAGAMCATRAAAGPGTPYFEGATPGFVLALAALDGGVAPPEASAALAAVLADARPLDAITLWHLLTRVDRRSAERVYDRLAALAPPSSMIDRGAVLSGDRAQLDLWWEQLGLGDPEVLRRGMRRIE